MAGRKVLYWVFQISGWGFLISISLIAKYSEEQILTAQDIGYACITFLTSILLTDLFRSFIIKKRWLDISARRAIPKVVIGSIVLGVLFYLTALFVALIMEWVDIGESSRLSLLLYDNNPEISLGGMIFRIVILIINYTIFCFIWTVIYFAFHFYERSRAQEIKTLQWEASKNENELNSLKSQLNPHFMFNAMNSIRALVDEDPKLAKKAITQLSGLLRSTLQTGKQKVVTIKEELKIVEDYLDLEKIRYEDRLDLKIDVNPEFHQALVPPLLIQTLMENAIKHGISSTAKGGILSLDLARTEDKLIITIKNIGKYVPPKTEGTGIGLKNSTKRLSLLYGSAGTLSIGNKDGLVHTIVSIPYQLTRIEQKTTT